MVTPALTSVDNPGSPYLEEDTGPRLSVTTLLVARHPDGHLGDTIDAVLAQDRRPERLIVIDTTPDRCARAWVDSHPTLRAELPGTSVVVAPPTATFADTIDIAVESLPDPGEDVVVTKRTRTRADKRPIRPRDKHEWLWLLHEDSVPAPQALVALVDTVTHSSRVGVAGCKVRELGTRQLVNVGLDVTRTGRHIGDRMQGEFDQGQHDRRSDVLAVSSSGLMIRRDVYSSLGGFDPAFDGDGDGLDLCWRAHLTGHQVVVVPRAIVHQDLTADDGRRHGDPDLPAPRSPRTLRRHRQVALARSSLLGWPLMSVWVFISSVLLGLVMLVVKRPRRAVAEFAQSLAPLGVGRIGGARGRFFGRATARRRHLAPLFVGTGAAWVSARESVLGALTVEGSSRTGRLVDAGVGETGPVDDGAVALAAPSRRHRVLGNPGLWTVLLLLVVAGVQWRHLLGSQSFQGRAGGISGGELRAFGSDAGGVWRLYRDAWTGAGLGGPNQVAEYLPTLAPFAWLIGHLPGLQWATSAATAVMWLLALTIPLSGLAAYRAGRILTHDTWPRAIVAVLWATTATATTASAQGRLGPAMAHVVAPLAFAGIVAVGRRRASGTITFATVLAIALLGAYAPLLLVFTTFGGLLVALFGPGWARLRGVVVAVLPWGLLGAQTRVILGDWRHLFAGPGGLVTGSTPAVDHWQVALLHPGGPGSTPVLLGLPLLALAVLGMLLPARTRSVIGIAVVALLGLTGALLAPHLHVMTVDAAPRSPWAGLPLDVFALGCAALALEGLGAVRRGRRAGWVLNPLTAALATLAALTVAGLGAWNSQVTTLHPSHAVLPTVLDSQLTGPRSVRVLVLATTADGSVSYRLVGRETGLPVTDFDPATAVSGAPTGAVVSRLVTGQGGSDLADDLRSLAIGYVVVRGAPVGQQQVAQSMQTGGGLVRMNSVSTESMWRVSPSPSPSAGSVAASRLLLADGAGRPLSEVTSTDWHAITDTRIPAGAAGRQLVVSELPGWRSANRVSVDGRTVRSVTTGGLVGYPVPPGSAHLRIEALPTYETTRWAQLALLAFVGFGALPFGNRASRRRAW
ncbi:glycosyltransferase [Calidifontibacter terrae]